MKKSLSLFITLFIFLFLISSSKTISQWQQFSNGITGHNAFTFTSQDNKIFVTGDYLYQSTDNGLNWTNLNHFGGLLAANSNYLYAGINGGVYRTFDFTSWSYIGPTEACIHAIGTNGNYVFIGATICAQANTPRFFVSSDNGTNWTLKPIGNLVRSIAVIGNNIFAGSTGGIYKSTDNGATWNFSPGGIDHLAISSLATNGTDIYAAGYNDIVYRTTDYGLNWFPTSLVTQYINTLATVGSNVFAGTHNHGVYASSNNGTNWYQRNDGLPLTQINSLYIFNGYIFAGVDTFNVYRRSLSELVAIQPISNEIPKSFSLSQNYPNPFNPSTKISFQIPFTKGDLGGFVRLSVYDIQGKQVSTLVNENLKPGSYEVEWNASNFPSGVYYYKIVSGDLNDTKKMVLIK